MVMVLVVVVVRVVLVMMVLVVLVVLVVRVEPRGGGAGATGSAGWRVAHALGGTGRVGPTIWEKRELAAGADCPNLPAPSA